MSIRVRQEIGVNVFDAAVDRMYEIYKAGHRVVISYSGGKDSTCTLEICLIAAQMAGRLPVEVQFRDEEVSFPGTFEFLVATARRPDVQFHWFICPQLPSINIFNRAEPYFWVYDDRLKPSQWMQEPPPFAEVSKFINIEKQVNPIAFPPAPGKKLFACIGLRVAESRGRLYGLFSSGGHITKPNALGVCSVRPIYDWSTADVWKAIHDNHWNYNPAYDVLFRMAKHADLKADDIRIAPPTLNGESLRLVTVACKAWPRWFDKLCERLPGVRTAAQFGSRSVQPNRHLGESWRDCFHRECIETAPSWIAARATKARDNLVGTHGRHSTVPFPEVAPCFQCQSGVGSWKKLAHTMYCGDPFSHKIQSLDYVAPSFFRPGAPDW